jgi:prolyl oligopeptidase
MLPEKTRAAAPAALPVLVCTVLASLFVLAFAAPGLAQLAQDDPFEWLESTGSARAVEWVSRHNRSTLQILAKDPRYPRVESEMRAILSAKDRLPYPHLRGGWVYNFWQDLNHPRGVWRRARPEDYAKPGVNWQTLLDLDRLNAEEKKNWMWQGEVCLPPAYEDCLLQLAHGGGDEVVVREFDVKTAAFVPNGFNLTEAVSNVSWLDADRVLVDTNFGPDTVLRSGYSRFVKLWKRGKPLADAKTLLEGAETDLWETSMVDSRPEGNYPLLVQFLSRFAAKYYLLLPDDHLDRISLPEDANVQCVFQGRLLAILRSPWKAGRRTLPSGALVAFPLDKIDEPHPEEAVELVYAPDDRSSIVEFDAAKNRAYLNVLRDVNGSLFELSVSSAGWNMQALELPMFGTVKVLSADAFDDLVYVSYENFLTPPAIYAVNSARAPSLIASLPERFNAGNFIVEQDEAVSADGTRVPYFLVRRKDLKFDGAQPTLLYGYGGFESSFTPTYLDTVGKAWLEAGGAYALANVRGGGEFGPAWHKAAMGEHRQRSFDDFLAVAQDLIQRKITSPRRLGIMGDSNGGLLAGAAMTERPDLFHAVVCQAPLFDMLRYNRLGAGAAWIGEYGDPDDPKMAKILRRYSPYQNVKPNVRYPASLFVSSTEDDRVNPAHARKMAARLESMGNEALYFEDTKGGHGGPNTDLESRIRRRALEFVFLLRQLMD